MFEWIRRKFSFRRHYSFAPWHNSISVLQQAVGLGLLCYWIYWGSLSLYLPLCTAFPLNIEYNLFWCLSKARDQVSISDFETLSTPKQFPAFSYCCKGLILSTLIFLSGQSAAPLRVFSTHRIECQFVHLQLTKTQGSFSTVRNSSATSCFRTEFRIGI